MPLVTVPFGFMRGVAEEVDHAFGITPGAQAGRWTPAVDVEHYGGKLVITAELPGFKKEEVKVELIGGALVIRGEHKRERRTEPEGYHRLERRIGLFYRSIPLPQEAKTDEMKASLLDGILTVTMPVAEVKNTEKTAHPAAA